MSKANRATIELERVLQKLQLDLISVDPEKKLMMMIQAMDIRKSDDSLKTSADKLKVQAGFIGWTVCVEYLISTIDTLLDEEKELANAKRQRQQHSETPSISSGRDDRLGKDYTLSYPTREKVLVRFRPELPEDDSGL